MGFCSPPNPDSIDPPQHTQQDRLPKSAPDTLGGIVDTAAVDSRPSSAMPIEPSSVEEIFGRRLCALAGFMRARPNNTPSVKVIAVDGSDRQAVRGMIANLQHRITKDLQYVVRVVSVDSSCPPTDRPTGLCHFEQQIECWGAMWEMIFHAPSISSELRPRKRAKPTRKYPDCPTVSFQRPLIHILPFSPMMATTQATLHVAGSSDTWRLLSGYWKDRFRPDVTINIHNTADTRHQYEVLRYQIQGMTALVVTKEENPCLNITPQQMRRVIFETEEWIRG